MQVEEVEISKLKFADYNPREITDHDFEALKNAIKEFGIVDPVIVNKDNTIIGGHMRVRVAQELGIEKVPVSYVDLPEDRAKLLNLDDDIVSIQEKLGDSEKEIEDLNDLIETGFKTAGEGQCHLWGIYPLVNHFYMNYNHTFDLRYIVGAFWGLINTHDKNTYVELEDKEDFERTIKFYIKDKRVLRFNYVGVETGYYKEPGGMQETRTEDRVKESVSFLLQKYPMFCEWNQRRKNHYEIKLKDRSRSVKKNYRIQTRDSGSLSQ